MTSYSDSSLALEKPAIAAGWCDYESGFGVVNRDFDSGVACSNPSSVTDFAALLREHIKRAGVGGGRAFARLSKTSQASVSKACLGGSVPLEHLPKWADALGLTGVERDEFFEAGRRAKAAAKKDIAPYVRQLESRVDALESGLAELVAMLRNAGAEIPESLLRLLDS